jgi:hypothetical protein
MMNFALWLLSVATVGAVLVMSNATGSAQTFHGDPCTDDCSGHEAGYNWAERHNIEDPDDCGGNSNSFIEGCQTYATEHQESLRENKSDNPDNGDENDPDDGAPDE